jgi:hypothetical protein
VAKLRLSYEKNVHKLSRASLISSFKFKITVDHRYLKVVLFQMFILSQIMTDKLDHGYLGHPSFILFHS